MGDPVKWHWASTIHDMGDDGYMGGSNMANMGYQHLPTFIDSVFWLDGGF